MGIEVTQVLQGRFRTKMETEGAKTRCAGSLFQYFTTRTEKAPLLRRRRLGPCSNRYAYPRRPARGGRRKNSDGLRSTFSLKILKARMRSARRRLRSKISCTVIGPKSSLQHLCNFGPHSLTIFSILLQQTIYVFP